MANRSRIGIMLPDESVLSVYHHWDGYPEWLGRILTTHYSSREKVTELIDGGDMSSCWTTMRWTKESAQDVEKYGPQYYSDRQDRVCEPRLDANKYDYLADGEEYAYLYTLDGEWICYDRHQWGDRYPTIAEIPSGALAA